MFNARAWNIALRTAHIGAMGVLLGGYAFDVPHESLRLSLWLTLITGVALGAIESGGRLLWFHQGRGLMTIAKLLLFCAVPLLNSWPARLTVMLVIVVIASVGSHAPARLRYYSVIYREVISDQRGPGTIQLEAEMNEAENDSPDR